MKSFRNIKEEIELHEASSALRNIEKYIKDGARVAKKMTQDDFDNWRSELIDKIESSSRSLDSEEVIDLIYKYNIPGQDGIADEVESIF